MPKVKKIYENCDILVIGGGISAYKSLDLIRLLLRKKSSVKVVLTKSGKFK